jgi:N-acetylglucosamine malate deacetylase 1
VAGQHELVDILAFDAHADDVELSCGGTIAAAVASGMRVGIVDLTRGEMGTRGTPAGRLRESADARKILGAAFRHTLDFGDGRLQTGREQELELIEIIRRHRPSLLIGPYPDDRHPDHRRAGHLLTDVWFYAGLRNLVTASPAHRPQAVVYYLLNYMVAPTFIVDVGAAWRTKMRAIAAYKSQFYNPRSKQPQTKLSQKAFLDMIEARGRHFGAMIGAEFGEAFYSKQPPRVDDLVAAFRGREIS